MAVGNFVSIRAHESARAAENVPEEEAHPWKHAAATFAAFVAAGALPLAPYLVGAAGIDRFAWSTGLTLASLFALGAARTLVTPDRWWRAGLEMLGIGTVVAASAYGAAALIASMLA
jgi:VIT1/CCC1 family predicted Fe2+/Mn2+ transporter